DLLLFVLFDCALQAFRRPITLASVNFCTEFTRKRAFLWSPRSDPTATKTLCNMGRFFTAPLAALFFKKNDRQRYALFVKRVRPTLRREQKSWRQLYALISGSFMLNGTLLGFCVSGFV